MYQVLKKKYKRGDIFEDLYKKINTSEDYGKPIVCVMTASKEESIIEKFKEMGALHYFIKPLNLVEIADSVYKIIESL